MIDYTKLKEKELSCFGIAFSDPDEAQLFSKYVREEIEVRIGEKISEGLSESKLREFDLISDPNEANKWLECNRPDYREIVNCQRKYLAWDLLRFGAQISTSTRNTTLHGVTHSITMLGLSHESFIALFDANLKLIKNVIDYSDLSNIDGLDETRIQEIITKIVNHLIPEEENREENDNGR